MRLWGAVVIAMAILSAGCQKSAECTSGAVEDQVFAIVKRELNRDERAGGLDLFEKGIVTGLAMKGIRVLEVDKDTNAYACAARIEYDFEEKPVVENIMFTSQEVDGEEPRVVIQQYPTGDAWNALRNSTMARLKGVKYDILQMKVEDYRNKGYDWRAEEAKEMEASKWVGEQLRAVKLNITYDTVPHEIMEEQEGYDGNKVGVTNVNVTVQNGSEITMTELMYSVDDGPKFGWGVLNFPTPLPPGGKVTLPLVSNGTIETIDPDALQNIGRTRVTLIRSATGSISDTQEEYYKSGGKGKELAEEEQERDAKLKSLETELAELEKKLASYN